MTFIIPKFLKIFLPLFCLVANGVAATFAPGTNEVILVIGQNVPSVESYVAATGQVPGGVMTYTSTARAEGLSTSDSYGAGLVHAQHFITNSIFQKLGLYLNGDLANITNGLRATNLATLGHWIKQTQRPVYLRIGYEFDFPDNALPPADYIAAYRYIVDTLRHDSVTNAAFVWHSYGAKPFNNFPVTAWYPGDDYVDWAGISVFQQFNGQPGALDDLEKFCAFARSRKKPLMICESAPFGGISETRWTNWFQPCLDLILREHVQMWCYINTDWEAQPLFAKQGWGDTRIDQNEFVKSKWRAAVSGKMFLQSSPKLFSHLQTSFAKPFNIPR